MGDSFNDLEGCPSIFETYAKMFIIQKNGHTYFLSHPFRGVRLFSSDYECGVWHIISVKFIITKLFIIL